MAQEINVTFPDGRLVQGSIYKPQTKDMNGDPIVYKRGPKVGQPRISYYFAVAVPKGQETHWNQTAWGKQIYGVGLQAFPAMVNNPVFAWKIVDGDSQVPNTKNHKPYDSEGWPGHWVVRCSSGFAPKVFRAEGGAWIHDTNEELIKPGYFIQVNATIRSNDEAAKPGVYINPAMVAFRGIGPEIYFGPDVNEAGFNMTPMEASLSTLPMPGSPPPPPVVPDPAFLNPPVHKMTPKAGTIPYSSYIEKGWTDALLIQHGMMEG